MTASRPEADRESVLRESPLGPLGDARFAPGRIFASRYRIVSLLGRGAMGEVYRAEDLRLRQPVALKLLSGHGSRGPDGQRRFVNEVRLARGIAHPNVCRVYDIGEAEKWHYLSMEYVDGETLKSLQNRIGDLSTEKALDIARQLCAGLAAAHDRGVLHRDLKPSNIMIDGRGRVRIMDFGLAVPVSEGSVREVAGTPAYMAPEQFAGERVTERTDLYALGLVLHELFAGRPFFAASTLEERVRQAYNPSVAAVSAKIDPRVAEIVAKCLESDPTKRPGSALSVAAVLPGGDPLEAALAEGRVPSPEMIAAAPKKGALRPLFAWVLLISVVAGALIVAWRGEQLTFSAAEVPKPAEVLAERSRQILARIGHRADASDREFWFDNVAVTATSASLRFVYRQSPQALVPQNLFHIVTPSDPPADVDGMATVMLDTSGRLFGLSRISTEGEQPVVSEPVWSELFSEAGLVEEDFVRLPAGRRPLVPHDRLVNWVPRGETSASHHVTAATLAGALVYFEVTEAGTDAIPRRRVFSSRRPPAAEALLWVFIVLWFATTTVMARRNLRAGEGDIAGARRLSLFAVCVWVVDTVLRAHHVPDPVEELILLLGVTGWALVWGGFSWLAYISFEPHVRRLWPSALISWTRLLSGRARDPLAGRDVLIGLLAGIVVTVLRLLFASHAPELLVGPALQTLRSVRHFTSMVAFATLDGLQFALGGLFFLLLLRLVLRRTWIAAGALLAVGAPLIGGTIAVGPDLAYGAATVLLFITIVLRVGLFATTVALISERLLTRLPITLDLTAWYLGSSLMVLLLILASAVYGFLVALAGRPAFGAKTT